jgi:putative PEP-CTERM system integral membrane protein
MDTTNQSTSTSPGTNYTRKEWVELVLFWSWNLIFVAFMLFGFGPVMLPDTFLAVRTGTIPLQFLLYALVLTLIPVACLILGLTVLRREPARLFALGYVIEGPLMLVLAIRFFAIRQSTPGLIVPIAVILFGMGGFLWTLLDKQAGNRRPVIEAFRLAGLTLMAVASLYAAAWIAFYALPLAVEGLRAIGQFFGGLINNLRNWGNIIGDMLINSPLMVPFSILGFILALYTATLFILTPIVVPLLSLRAWWRSLKGQVKQLGWLRPAIVVAAVLVASAGLFVLTNHQPQGQAFALLEKPPASVEEASALLERSDSIRTGLLNAYLAPFRYISAQGEVRHVSEIYQNTFKITHPKAFAVQRLYERFASPLLYQPVQRQEMSQIQDNHALTTEPKEAARLYQQFFDEPINEAERQTVVNAVRSTWSANQAEAAWQVVDDREVHLVNQDVTINEHGDWADIELHEVYQNQTTELQEAIYYFSLPESAVITGLWLGDTPEKAQANAFQVAPRGAAQAVYREQTRVQKDPALVEQIGPRQYRLRVYPVPRMRAEFDELRSRTIVENAPELHLWLAWREMASPDGWPMPDLALKRNVYWDGETVHLVNGQPFETGPEEWLPESFPASASIVTQAHRVDLPGDQTVLAVPASQVTLPALPESLRLAVVVDRSHSMQANASLVSGALEQIKAISTPEAPVDVYLTASPYRGEGPARLSLDDLDPAKIIYFGGQNPGELIAQFQALRGDRDYDAVLVLTDGSGYELGAGDFEISVPDAPVWMIHLGDELSIGYDDPTLQAIQASGGGVATDVDTALKRLAFSLSGNAQSKEQPLATSDLVDGYLWTTQPTNGANAALILGPVETHDQQDGFAALAARSLVLAEMQRNQGTIDQLETLDYLHSLATQYGIVTPYSSMIVLVDFLQQDLLNRFNQMEDRYEREVEALGETAPASPVPLAGVPEPHEWLLMGLAAAILIYYVYTKRKPALIRVIRSR